MAKKVAKKKIQKKALKSEPTGKSGVHASKITASTQEIWLAGLGAFALAQDEGTKLFKEGAKAIEGTGKRVMGEGVKLFDRLVREGNKVQSVGRKMAEEAVEDVREDVTGRVSKVRQGAQANWDRLEKVFEERVAKALTRLGVPTSSEIEALMSQVVKLNDEVKKLNAAQSKTTGSKTASTKKVTGKKAPSKKRSAKPASLPSTPKQS